jgi:hypothetical protein
VGKRKMNEQDYPEWFKMAMALCIVLWASLPIALWCINGKLKDIRFWIRELVNNMEEERK